MTTLSVVGKPGHLGFQGGEGCVGNHCTVWEMLRVEEDGR